MTFIKYLDAIRLFEAAQRPDQYIANDLQSITQDKKEIATLSQIDGLARIALEGLRQEQNLSKISHAILRADALAVKNYLTKRAVHYKAEPICLRFFKYLCQENPALQLEEEISNLRFEPTIEPVPVEKALELAQKDGEKVSAEIHTYGIKDEADRIAIAKAAMKQNSFHTTEWFRNYGIKDPAALFEIVKIAIEGDVFGSNLPWNIKNFDIQDQELLNKIALMAAEHNPSGIALGIENFGITDQALLVKIALMAAKHCGTIASQRIHQFRITNQKDLVKIAKISIKTEKGWVYRIAEEFPKYGIKSERERIKLCCLTLKREPAKCYRFLNNFDIKELKGFKDFWIPKASAIREIFKWPEEFASVFQTHKFDIDDSIFLIFLGLKFKLKTPHATSDLWSAILNINDLAMRYELADMVFRLNEQKAKLHAATSKPEYLRLPSLILCSKYKDERDIAKLYQLINRKEFKDGMMQKALTDTLFLLVHKLKFNPNECFSLLSAAFKEKNIRTALFSIQGTLNCDGEKILREEAHKEKPNLDAAYQAAFKQTIPIKTAENFSEKYERTFGRCALPSAPLIYAGKLKELSETEIKMALPVLTNFIDSVLEGSYHEQRYQDSEHLKLIYSHKPHLREEWPKNTEKPLEEYLNDSRKISFDPQQFLQLKILRDRHLPREKFPIIYDYLEASSESKKKIAEELTAALAGQVKAASDNKRQAAALRNALSQLADIEGRKDKDQAKKLMKFLEKQPEKLTLLQKFDLTEADSIQFSISKFKEMAKEALLKLKQDDGDRQNVLLHKDLIDFCQNSKAPLSQHLNQLIKIQGKLDTTYEFMNDVSGVVKALQENKQSFDGYTLANTDSFDHLLLCGTEVQGSCQRIDGSPYTNKCLLAYLMDGKHRLIAILDKEKKIVARSIFRLLWDKKHKQPALMLERVYSNVLDQNLHKAIEAFAKEQALRLGLDCYTSEDQGMAELESIDSGIAPWEYVDSAAGVKERGRYIITNACKL